MIMKKKPNYDKLFNKKDLRTRVNIYNINHKYKITMESIRAWRTSDCERMKLESWFEGLPIYKKEQILSGKVRITKTKTQKIQAPIVKNGKRLIKFGWKMIGDDFIWRIRVDKEKFMTRKEFDKEAKKLEREYGDVDTSWEKSRLFKVDMD